MKDNSEKLRTLLDNSKHVLTDKKELSFKTHKLFDLKIIDKIENESTDFDFKDLYKTIKKETKEKDVFAKLEIFKDKLKIEGIDYKSNFFIRVITS